jgi:hypothetical protein
MQRLRAERIGPTDERRIIGDPLKVHPREPAQHQAVLDSFFGFLETPAIEMLEEKHAQKYFHWRGVPSMHQRPAVPFSQIRSHGCVELVIVEQVI